mmetsp:Transcript_3523/g.8982  ORF Transcript_3523/g.8982 Transcript_3523/m.8982 type:complete len:296 (-) Transcript_3523:644-1531(-)
MSNMNLTDWGLLGTMSPTESPGSYSRVKSSGRERVTSSTRLLFFSYRSRCSSPPFLPFVAGDSGKCSEYNFMASINFSSSLRSLPPFRSLNISSETLPAHSVLVFVKYLASKMALSYGLAAVYINPELPESIDTSSAIESPRDLLSLSSFINSHDEWRETMAGRDEFGTVGNGESAGMESKPRMVDTPETGDVGTVDTIISSASIFFSSLDEGEGSLGFFRAPETAASAVSAATVAADGTASTDPVVFAPLQTSASFPIMLPTQGSTVSSNPVASSAHATSHALVPPSSFNRLSI